MRELVLRFEVVRVETQLGFELTGCFVKSLHLQIDQSCVIMRLARLSVQRNRRTDLLQRSSIITLLVMLLPKQNVELRRIAGDLGHSLNCLGSELGLPLLDLRGSEGVVEIDVS